MAKPTRIAMTIICSMLADEIGFMKLEGKMLTTTSSGALPFGASNDRLDVARTGKIPLAALATARPMVTAIAVVQR